MNITIINDCNDPNDSARQVIRVKSLFKTQPTFIAVKNELEASGNIIDAIDANENKKGVIIVNVAPRGGKGKKFKNGTPFGYFWYKKILIVSSIDGLTLSLVNKLKMTKFINILDTEESLNILADKKYIKQEQISYIKNSQFRSFDFEPRVAYYLWKNKSIKSKKISIGEISDVPKAIWWVDNFGNCKTTVFAKEYNLKFGNFLKTNFGKLKYYKRLKDVPDKKPAIITGSSGLGKNRFLEVVIQGKNAAKY
ncbi:MAG: hypothetical protein A2360_04025, partial [Candidatus Staskawiczbacteria bacterium RIFOXYB1_FULL_32_11]